MNCYQITFKSGTQVQVYTETDFLAIDAKLWIDHHSIDPNEVACIIEITQNIKNGTLYHREHIKHLADQEVFQAELKVKAQQMYDDKHPQLVKPWET